jgi:uncharacterized DUF497 family protein
MWTHDAVTLHACHLRILQQYTIVIDWARIEGFDWDDGNSRKSVERHGVGQAEAEQVFFNEPLLVVEDARHSEHEARLHALGHTDDGHLLHVTFTLRRDDTMIRVISARAMHRKERLRYEQED